MTHWQQHSWNSLRVHVSGAHRRRVSVQWCDLTSEFQFHTWRSTGLKNRSAHGIQWTISTKLLALDGTSGEPHQGGVRGSAIERGAKPALTRRVTQFQDGKTPSHEEFGIYSLETSQQRSPADDSQFPQTYPTTASPSKSAPTRSTVRDGPARTHRTHRWWSHGAHERHKHGSQTLTQEKCGPAATA